MLNIGSVKGLKAFDLLLRLRLHLLVISKLFEGYTAGVGYLVLNQRKLSPMKYHIKP